MTRLRVCVYQGGRLWPDEEMLARLGLGGYATRDEVTSRLTLHEVRVSSPITVGECAIVVRLPVDPLPSQPEVLIAALQQQILELQRARQNEAARADRAEASCRDLRRQLDHRPVVLAADGCTDPDDQHTGCEVPCGLVGCDPSARRAS